MDGSVSNLSIISFPAGLDGGRPESTEITLTDAERARLEKAAKKRRAPFARFADVDDPKTAFLDTTASRHARITYSQALEEAPRESTTPNPDETRLVSTTPESPRTACSPQLTLW